MSSFTRIQLEDWLKTIDVKGSVLDVGGSQSPVKGRTKSWEVDDYKILDLEQPHKGNKPDIVADLNKNNLFLIKRTSGDKEEFKKYFQLTEEEYAWRESNEVIDIKYMDYFNVAFMVEVSEYLFRPLRSLYTIAQMLDKGGTFYSSWHFIYPQHPPEGLDYLRYTPAGVEKLLIQAGFTIEEHIPRTTERIDLEQVWSAEQMRGWKDFDNTIIGSLVKARKK